MENYLLTLIKLHEDEKIIYDYHYLHHCTFSCDQYYTKVIPYYIEETAPFNKIKLRNSKVKYIYHSIIVTDLSNIYYINHSKIYYKENKFNNINFKKEIKSNIKYTERNTPLQKQFIDLISSLNIKRSVNIEIHPEFRYNDFYKYITDIFDINTRIDLDMIHTHLMTVKYNKLLTDTAKFYSEIIDDYENQLTAIDNLMAMLDDSENDD